MGCVWAVEVWGVCGGWVTMYIDNSFISINP